MLEDDRGRSRSGFWQKGLMVENLASEGVAN
jgi:hypothetical protein